MPVTVTVVVVSVVDHDTEGYITLISCHPVSLCDLLAPPKIIALFRAQKMPLKKRAKVQRREHTLTGMPAARKV